MTISEELFESYLQSRCLQYDREPCFDGKMPDYGIKAETAGYQAIVEVKELDRPDSAPPPGSSEAFGVDSYTPIREKINVAAKQFRGCKDLPCMLVLYSDFYRLGDSEIYGAMLGDLTIRVPLDPALTGKVSNNPDGEIIFGLGGKMRFGGQATNTTISAIGVLESEYVIRYRCGLDEEMAAIDFEGTTLAEAMNATGPIWNRYQAAGYDLERRELRLRIHLNPFARIPWPDSLRGDADDIWGPDETGRLDMLVNGLSPRKGSATRLLHHRRSLHAGV